MPHLTRKKNLKVCQAKKTYYDEDEAWAVARALRRDKGVNAKAYRCNGQRGQRRHWHVTSGSW